MSSATILAVDRWSMTSDRRDWVLTSSNAVMYPFTLPERPFLVGPAGYFGQGEPEPFIVKGVGPGCVGGQGHHLLPTGLGGSTADGVFAARSARLLVAGGAGTCRGFQEVGEGHCLFSDCVFLVLSSDSGLIVGDPRLALAKMKSGCLLVGSRDPFHISSIEHS